MKRQLEDLLAHLDDPTGCEQCAHGRTSVTRLTRDRARFPRFSRGCFEEPELAPAAPGQERAKEKNQQATGGAKWSYWAEGWGQKKLDCWYRNRFVQTRGNAALTAEQRARLRASLGAELRALRAEFGISQWVLSVRAGVARSTVERLESGERRPSPSMLASLVVAAPWSVPPRKRVPHEVQVAWFGRLVAAAGTELVADTPGGLRRRSRRLRSAERAWRVQAYRAHQAALAAEVARRRRFMAGVRVLARARSPQAIERAMSGLGW